MISTWIRVKSRDDWPNSPKSGMCTFGDWRWQIVMFGNSESSCLEMTNRPTRTWRTVLLGNDESSILEMTNCPAWRWRIVFRGNANRLAWTCRIVLREAEKLHNQNSLKHIWLCAFVFQRKIKQSNEKYENVRKRPKMLDKVWTRPKTPEWKTFRNVRNV